MIYRIVASLVLVLILGVAAMVSMGEGASSPTSPAAPASAAGPDDSAMKSLKIE